MYSSETSPNPDKQTIPYFNELSFISLVSIYTYLFYQQGIGINYFIFSTLIPIVYLIKNKKLMHNPSFLLVGFGVIFTGFLCFYYGSEFHLFLNKTSLLLLAGMYYAPKSSLILATFNSFFTYVTLPITLILDLFSLKNQPVKKYGSIVKYLFLSIIPIILAAVFLIIYSISNPILTQFLSQLNFKFISIGFILFGLYAFVVIYGLMRPKGVDSLVTFEEKKANNLNTEQNVLYTSFLKFFSIKSEIYIASAVFILLNLILGLNNGLDVYYLFIKKILPLHLSYTDFIHQGVNALILSIFLAIGLIMYFFSSRLNFIKNAQFIKALAYIWIVQNGMLVYLCFYKNQLYITNYGLTYKRIGVYTFLLLALIGLGCTFWKILKYKTNYFLIRKNSWALYLTVVMISSYDWDQAITNYNLNICKNKNIDFEYLLSLDHTSIPLLYQKLIVDKADYDSTKNLIQASILYDDGDAFFTTTKETLVHKIENLKKAESSYGAVSYCYSRNEILSKY